MRIRARCGKVKGTVTVQFGAAPAKTAQFTVACVDMPDRNHHWGTSKLPPGLPDAALLLRLSGAIGRDRRQIERVHFIRPDVHFYSGEDLAGALKAWPGLPPASQREFVLTLVRKDQVLEIWMDGRYFSNVTPDPAWKGFATSASGGAQVLAAEETKDAEDDRYLPLDMVGSSGGVDSAERLPWVEGFPGDGAPARRYVDVTRSRWLDQAKDSDSFYDPYYKRSAWDAVPETIMFSVPKRFYNYAHVLCAVDARDGRSASMSVRVARYRQAWDGSGATQADTTVVLDPEKPRGCASCKKVADIDLRVGKETRMLPLYQAEIPLKTGELADYLQMNGMDWQGDSDFLYLEFTRELRTRVNVNSGVFETKPLGPQSGVYLLGVTLEKTPVWAHVKSSETGPVLHRDANARLPLELTNSSRTARKLKASWRIRSYYGVSTGLDKTFEAPPGVTSVPLLLGESDLGWYHGNLTLSDEKGRPLWSLPFPFALLPPDTRRAGDESPFGMWWFAGAHYCEPHADRVLPLIQKMGFRHVAPQTVDPKNGRTPENFARYKVTPSMIGRLREGKKGESIDAQAAASFKDWPTLDIPTDGPIPIPGQPNAIGVWVKGNSGWGRVYFEVLDARGRRWTSNGWREAPGSWDMSDWEDETTINFDGWRFISLGLPLHYPSGYYTPDFRHWRCQGDNSKTNRLAYPLKLNRLYVVLREKIVYVTDRVPVRSLSIDVKDVTAFIHER